MNRLFSTLILTSFLLTSCSSFTPMGSGWSRSIAEEKVKAPLTLEELLFFPAGSEENFHRESDFLSQIKRRLELYEHTSLASKYKFILDPKMNDQEAFRIVPSIEGKNYVLNIFYSANRIGDVEANAELGKFLTRLHSISKQIGLHSFFELYSNAKAGDITSLAALASLRRFAEGSPISTDTMISFQAGEFPYTNRERGKYWAKVEADFKKIEKEISELKKPAEIKRLSKIEILNKLASDKQFYTLVAKNDRKGASALLRSYLPWEDMSPFELKYWETQLDIMENPVALEDRILVYQKYNDPLTQAKLLPLDENGVIISEVDALKSQKMISVAKFIDEVPGNSNEKLQAVTSLNTSRVSGKGNQVTNFLSLRNSLQFKIVPTELKETTAMAAYFIDPRALHLVNFESTVNLFHRPIDPVLQGEFSGPLVTFPDELVAVYNNKVVQLKEDPLDFINRSAIEKLSLSLGTNEGAEKLEKINKATLNLQTNMLNLLETSTVKDMARYKNFVVDDKLTDILKANFPQPAVDKTPLSTVVKNPVRKLLYEHPVNSKAEFQEEPKGFFKSCAGLLKSFF